MNIVEMYELCKTIYNANVRTSENWDTGYEFIGLRFEDKQRSVGDICENSRHNDDRDDERDFPDYESEEYYDLHELDGTSAWDLLQDSTTEIGRYENREDDCSRHFGTQHCYIIASNSTGNNSDVALDVNEIVIKDAVVIAQIF